MNTHYFHYFIQLDFNSNYGIYNMNDRTSFESLLIHIRDHSHRYLPYKKMTLYKTSYTETNQSYLYNYSNRIRIIQRAFRNRGKRIQARTAIIKEELMAAVWTPKRVMRWLEDGMEMD